jgi:hypothetical protein
MAAIAAFGLGWKNRPFGPERPLDFLTSNRLSLTDEQRNWL